MMLPITIYHILLLNILSVAALIPADITETLYTNCPITSFAYRDGDELRSNVSFAPCCASCVTENCGERAPCCPDYKIAKMTSKCTTVQHSMVFDPFAYLGYDQLKFWIVISCKPMYNGTLHEQNCHNRRIIEPFNTTLVQPVVDSTTRIIYANKFCAFCNGVDESSFATDIFPSLIRCFFDSTSVLSSQGSLELLEMSLRTGQCFYYFSPTSPDYVYESRCVTYDIEKCNITGQWENYDPILEEACEAYDMTYTFLNILSTVYYKNFHCFLCNGNIPNEREDVCREESISFFYRKSFSLILGIDVKKEHRIGAGHYSQPLAADGICPVTQFWDSEKNKCRDVICATTRTMTDLGCIPLLTSLKDIIWTINILWIIPFDSGTIEEKKYIDLMVEFVADNFNKSFLLKYNNIISPVDTNIYFRLAESKLWILVKTAFIYEGENDKHPAIAFIKDFRSTREITYNKKDINVNIIGTILNSLNIETFWFEARVFGQYLEPILRVKSDDYESHYIKNEDVVASTTLVCDLVLLDHDEYSLSMYGSLTITRNNLFLTGVEYMLAWERDGVMVCIQDFLSPNSNDSNLKQTTGSQMLVVLFYLTASLSVAFLLLVLLAFSIFKPLRTDSGKVNICLCVSVMLLQCLHIPARYLNDDHQICKILGLFIHFFRINNIAWLIICAFQCFRPFETLNCGNSRCIGNCFLMYSFLATTVFSALFVAANGVFSTMATISSELDYHGQHCDVSPLSSLIYLSFIPSVLLLSVTIILLARKRCQLEKQSHLNDSKIVEKQNVRVILIFSIISLFYRLSHFLHILLENDNFGSIAMIFELAKGVWLYCSMISTYKVVSMLAKLFAGDKREECSD